MRIEEFESDQEKKVFQLARGSQTWIGWSRSGFHLILSLETVVFHLAFAVLKQHYKWMHPIKDAQVPQFLYNYEGIGG